MKESVLKRLVHFIVYFKTLFSTNFAKLLEVLNIVYGIIFLTHAAILIFVVINKQREKMSWQYRKTKQKDVQPIRNHTVCVTSFI